MLDYFNLNLNVDFCFVMCIYSCKWIYLRNWIEENYFMNELKNLVGLINIRVIIV